MVLFALFQDVVIYKWSPPPRSTYLIFLNKYIWSIHKLWYIIICLQTNQPLDTDPSIPSLTNQHEGLTKREMHCLLPCLCFLNKWRTKPRMIPSQAGSKNWCSQGLAALIQGQICSSPVCFWGKSKKIISAVWCEFLPFLNGWEGETSTWRMIFFLSVLFGSQMLHGPWVRPMLRWLMGYGDVQLLELFGTKRSEQIKQNSWQGRALNQPSGLVAWTWLDTCFKHPGDLGYFGTWQGRLRGFYWWLRHRHQVGKKKHGNYFPQLESLTIC